MQVGNCIHHLQQHTHMQQMSMLSAGRLEHDGCLLLLWLHAVAAAGPALCAAVSDAHVAMAVDPCEAESAAGRLSAHPHLLEHLAGAGLRVPFHALQLSQHLPTRQVFQHQHLRANANTPLFPTRAPVSCRDAPQLLLSAALLMWSAVRAPADGESPAPACSALCGGVPPCAPAAPLQQGSSSAAQHNTTQHAAATRHVRRS